MGSSVVTIERVAQSNLPRDSLPHQMDRTETVPDPFFRIWAPLHPTFYFQFLGWAGVAWILGLSIWGIVFSRRAVFRHFGKDGAPHHDEEGCGQEDRSAPRQPA